MAQMLHTQPYRLSSGYRQSSAAQSATIPALLQACTPYLLRAYRYVLKVTLIFLVTVGFLACASYILASSAGPLLKLAALTAWACGFVPVSHYLWSRDHAA
ncbi:MAG: hypothetical protein R3A44_22210 [Caldilineaceae bacterium]